MSTVNASDVTKDPPDPMDRALRSSRRILLCRAYRPSKFWNPSG
jgi:hypothetical protein